MRFRPLSLLTLAVIFTLLAPYQPVLAARGVPGSSEFGYGAHLHLDGLFPIESVHLASDLQIDWLWINLSWREIAPKQNAIDWGRIDPILRASAHSTPSIVVSLTQPPDWALNAQGPDPVMVAQLVTQLVQRYPQVIKAIEIFPSANTRNGWGRQPDAQAYIKVIQAAQTTLQKLQSKVLLVAGGLKPVLTTSDPGRDMDDLFFLQALYSAGLKNSVNIISVDASSLTGEPLQAPAKTEPRVLRHYEEIRSVMLNNHHETGLVWITHLTPPDGSIQSKDNLYKNFTSQSDWLSQAYGQLKSQLYIGVAFLDGINPASDDPERVTLIEKGGDYHPFYRVLRDLITINRSDSSHNRPGRAKDQPLVKSAK